MLRLNAEFYPKSADIDLMLAEVLLEKGDREAAIASFRAALEKQPNNARAKQRLEELTKK
jgi:Flp pilus assembly protein TadD